MAQFDIHRLANGQHIIDLQSDFIDLRESRLAAPIFREGARVTLGRLTPIITHEGNRWIVRVPQLSAMRPSTFGPAVGSADAWRDDLFLAIDLLTHGF